mmetsp:Transcript_16873/g.28232  ORF Transcript_16873/g.28232 Transcript_16873/m.28232 type:complete len:419 (+) Transcript_16873:163-1419(+)
MPEFDPIAVKSKADKIVADDKSKIEDARNLFLEELFDWTDFYTETYPSDEAGPPSSVDNGEQLATKRKTYEAIIELWIQFTAFEISLHQYKKAVDVFEKALIDTLGSKSVVLFIAYAAFCVDRKKLANAQKVYIRGLCAGLASQEENWRLWQNFLSLTHTVNKSTDLTVDQLYEAVKKQQGVDSSKLAAPSPPLSIPSTSSALPAPSHQQDNANQAPSSSSSSSSSSNMVGSSNKSSHSVQPTTSSTSGASSNIGSTRPASNKMNSNNNVQIPAVLTFKRSNPTTAGVIANTSVITIATAANCTASDSISKPTISTASSKDNVNSGKPAAADSSVITSTTHDASGTTATSTAVTAPLSSVASKPNDTAAVAPIVSSSAIATSPIVPANVSTAIEPPKQATNTVDDGLSAAPSKEATDT